MSPERLQARVPSAEPLMRGRLDGHRLCWHKHGRHDNSGKCDAYFTGRADAVHGLIYRMSAGEKHYLDAAEGLGNGYEVKDVEVALADGRRLSAFTYYATDIESSLAPLCWYKEHVLRGARYAGLPAPYVEELEAVVDTPDTDRQRRAGELAIYLDAQVRRAGE